MSDSQLRSRLIRLASTLSVGSSERKALLDVLDSGSGSRMLRSTWRPARTDSEVFERGNADARALIKLLDKVDKAIPKNLEGFPGPIGTMAVDVRLALVALSREIMKYESRGVQAAESWWAHALGGLSKISYGPFKSAAAAKKFLLDRDHNRDQGPFKADPHTGGWVGDSHSIEQTPPKPGRTILPPR